MLFARTARTLATKTSAFTPLSLNQQKTFAKAFSSSTFRMTLISDAIKDDHRKINEYYENIINAKDNDTKVRWQNQFVWELARHSVAEELIVYPAFEKYLGKKGEEMASKDRHEHQAVKEQLKIFQNLKPSDPKFETTLTSLITDLREHIKEEELDDMPALESALTTQPAGISENLVKKFGRTKAFVPSRSHPSAGSGHEGPAGWVPPYETAMGLLVAPIDHVRDMFAKFPDVISPNPSTK